MVRRFWVETLGCPKNQVDSDKLTGTLLADGLVPADAPDAADVVVVNTCAFVEEARQESIDTILALADARRDGADLVVTGCLAERYGVELAEALPEVDRVAGFGVPLTGAAPAAGAAAGAVPVSLGPTRAPGSGYAPVPRVGTSGTQNGEVTGSGYAPVPRVGTSATQNGRAGVPVPELDLLNLPRPAATVPWAYVKVAEGCDRACGFCAIPSFRGAQRSRPMDAILDEVDRLAAGPAPHEPGMPVREVVLVAQDLASYGRDQGRGDRAIVPLVEAVAARVDRVRLLYLYPSDLTDGLVDAVCSTGVPYFDLSLQHVSRPLLRRMRRWGDGDRFLARIADIRRREPDAAFRSNFIVGYPGETETDHRRLLRFVEEAQLDWCGFFAFSREPGTHADGLDGHVERALIDDRLAELTELQDAITAARRDDLIGRRVEVLVDAPGEGRTHREAPEIDGVVRVPAHLEPGTFAAVAVTAALGPDLDAAAAAA